MINGCRIPPPPSNLFEVQVWPCLLSKGIRCSESESLSLLFHKRLHKWGSVSLAWVFLCTILVQRSCKVVFSWS